MSLSPRIHEDAIDDAPILRMAGLIFDERPAALRGSLQVFVAVMIGLMMGNSLNMMI